jgi:hypothetical protein
MSGQGPPTGPSNPNNRRGSGGDKGGRARTGVGRGFGGDRSGHGRGGDGGSQGVPSGGGHQGGNNPNQYAVPPIIRFEQYRPMVWRITSLHLFKCEPRRRSR